jgi:predicted GTPase
VILLVGVTGSGKSTTGNCLYNKSGQMKSITDSPFLTSDQATGVTKKFEMISSDGITILDTIGYGDPQFKDQPDVIAKGMMEMLKRVNYKVDCVIFVVKKGRFSQEIVNFFRDIQENVLSNKCEANSILLVTDCSKEGWVNQQKNNPYMVEALKSCQNRFFEFYLKFDLEDDDDDDKKKNLEKRQKAIDKLVNFVSDCNFPKVDIILPKKEVQKTKDGDTPTKAAVELKKAVQNVTPSIKRGQNPQETSFRMSSSEVSSEVSSKFPINYLS